MKAAILLNGTPPSADLLRWILPICDLIVCADGAATWAKQHTPIDILVGDMDSLLDVESAGAKEVLRLPAEKNETDAQIAVAVALERGATDLTLLGATGRRLDHTLGNVHVLYTLCEKNIPARIIDEYNTVLVATGLLELRGERGDLLSLLPMEADTVIQKTEGLYYPLEDFPLELGLTRGISNVFTGEFASVRIKGHCIVVRPLVL